MLTATRSPASTARSDKSKCRLHGIDSPEKTQPFGSVACKALGELIEGKVVEFQQVDKDRYGRVVANVPVGGVHVNRELVAKGLAWRYVQYDKKGEFTQVEQAAKVARKGLWGEANPVPPWEWRKSEKERRAAERAKSTSQSGNRVTF